MKRTPIKCRLLKSIGYDKESKILEIEFLDMEVRDYSDVPEKVHDEIMSTDRKRLYFLENIKGKYNDVVVKPSKWQ